MTIRVTSRAMAVTLVAYSFMLFANLAVLWLIARALPHDFPAPGLLTAIDALVGLVALGIVLVVLHAFAALFMARVSADAERVWVPRPLGAREVRRSDLARIRQARLSQPLARGAKVYQFIRRDGSVAFHIQGGVYSAGDISALADYLQVPIDTPAH